MKPPRLAMWLASLRIDRAEREFALGDLEEDFLRLRAEQGGRAARRWYWRQALRSVLGGWSIPRVHHVFSDIRFALRAIARAPAASLSAILTYALGIGANVAIFAVAWPVLVAPLPFPDEGRLANIWLTYRTNSATQLNALSAGDYADIRPAKSFAETAAYATRTTDTNMLAGSDPRPFRIGYVTPSYFTVMGIGAVRGRILVNEDAAGGARRLVLNERTWRAQFGADESLVGRVVRLDGESYEIAGIVPAYTGLGSIDADGWSALAVSESRERQRAYFLQAIGRLAPGVTLDQANQELAAIMARAALDFPDANRHLSARAIAFRAELTGSVRRSLLVLAGGALLLLLIAGVNLAGLLIARNVQRAHEMRLRGALGASRGRLMTLLVAENMTLAAIGGFVGLAAAAVTLRAIQGLAPDDAMRAGGAVATPLVLLFTIGLSLLSGLLIALVPALKSTRPSGVAVSARGMSASREAARLRTVITAAQVAFTVTLLIVAALVGTSLARVLSVDPGFRLTEALVADIKLPENRYDNTVAITGFFDTLVERSRALPGVRGACLINQMPLEPRPGSMTWVAEGTERMVTSNPKSVTPDCMAVLGIPVIRGRMPGPREPAPAVAVSASMARALFPGGQDPIGRHIHMGLKSGPLMTIVGVVGDVRNRSLDTRVVQQVWLPQASGYFTPRHLVLSAAVPAAGLATGVRSILRDLDPELALADVRTIDQIVQKSTAPRRFLLALLGGFAALALVLSGVGIYGVLAHLVAQRRREIGIRLALGARPSHIARVVAGSLGVAVLVGTAAGLIAAWSLSAVVASLLYETSARDLRIYASVAIAVSAIAMLAAWAPARRARRVDPAVALAE